MARASRTKSLAAFRDHALWRYERNYGLKNGYLASYVAEAMFLAVRLDIGSGTRTKRPALDAMRTYVEDYVGYRRRLLIEEFRKTPRKLFNNGRRELMHRQLMGLRLFRDRMREEMAKGDESYPVITHP